MRIPGFILLSASLLLLACGCKSIGPPTVSRDRFAYSESIGESWKRQTLLNIVKLRYLDPPIFVDVGQIVSGYTLETGMSVGGTLQTGADSLTLGGYGTYTDRPTITYTPLTGNRFIKSLMTPLTPDSVFFLIQAGWPADAVLFAAASSINRLKNQQSTVAGTTPPEPEFLQALALLRKIQLSGCVAFRIEKDAQDQQTALLTFRRVDMPAETQAEAAELRRLLHLDPDAKEFKLVFAEVPANDKELAVVTRSILQLMQTMAAGVEVPERDVVEQRAAPGWESVPHAQEHVRALTIRSSNSHPPETYVAVQYRGQWFWIDDRDLKSKRAFAFMMMLFTLADTGEKENLPLITIPTQ